MRPDRLIALLFIIIPGLIAAYGWDLMRTSFVDSLAEQAFPYLKFFLGLLLFLAGLSYLAGYNFYKDKKRRYLKPKYLKGMESGKERRSAE